MAHLEGRREIHHRRLPLDRLGDLPPPVAGVDAPEPRRAVDDRPAVGRVVVHFLGAGEHPRVRLVRAVRGVRHPQRIEVVGRRGGDLVHVGLRGTPARSRFARRAATGIVAAHGRRGNRDDRCSLARPRRRGRPRPRRARLRVRAARFPTHSTCPAFGQAHPRRSRRAVRHRQSLHHAARGLYRADRDRRSGRVRQHDRRRPGALRRRPYRRARNRGRAGRARPVAARRDRSPRGRLSGAAGGRCRPERPPRALCAAADTRCAGGPSAAHPASDARGDLAGAVPLASEPRCRSNRGGAGGRAGRRERGAILPPLGATGDARPSGRLRVGAAARPRAPASGGCARRGVSGRHGSVAAFIAGIVVRTDDGNAAARGLLRDAGIRHRALDAGLLVDAAEAGGGTILFAG